MADHCPARDLVFCIRTEPSGSRTETVAAAETSGTKTVIIVIDKIIRVIFGCVMGRKNKETNHLRRSIWFPVKDTSASRTFAVLGRSCCIVFELSVKILAKEPMQGFSLAPPPGPWWLTNCNIGCSLVVFQQQQVFEDPGVDWGRFFIVGIVEKGID
jgi:hypothetical protein